MSKWVESVKMVRVGHGLVLAALVLGSAACSGEDGAPGQTGLQGDPGPIGEMGEPGTNGETGPKGEPGRDGKDGTPGADGEKGDPGAKGDTGDTGAKGDIGDTGAKGDTGDAGFFVLKDGAGAVLGTIVAIQQGLFLVRGPQDALIYYSASDGRVLSSAVRSSDPLYFASADCSGPFLVSATVVDAGVIARGQLYKATLPFSSQITSHSETHVETGACIVVDTTQDLMAPILVGAIPPQAALPLSIE